MKKRLVLTCFLMLCVILSVSLGVTTALAGVNTTSPIGDGLVDGVELNEENFLMQEDSDTSAYSIKKGNTTYVITGDPWRGTLIFPTSKVAKADLVQGSKVVIQFDVLSLGTMWTQCMYISPFSEATGWTENHFNVRINTAGSHLAVAPSGSEIWINNTKVTAGDGYYEGFGLQGDILNAQKTAGRDSATYWLEYDIDTSSMTVYGGNEAANVKTEYGTLKNAFTLADGVESFYMNIGFDNNAEIDNFKTYLKVGGDVTKTYCDVDFEDTTKVLNVWDAKEGCLALVSSYGNLKTYDSQIIVTNPTADARITTLNPLNVVDSDLERAFELEVSYKLQTMVATRKVGLGFGLSKYDTKLSNPKSEVTFVYLSINNENKVVLGVDKINASGEATAVMQPTVLEDAQVGADASNVNLKINGLSSTVMEILYGEDSVYKVEGVTLKGNFTFAQTGTGDVTYGIVTDGFDLIAYDLIENEGEAVSSSFDGNYINENKFTVNATIAQTGYYEVQETTNHEVTGLVAENGKLGFYGTSTNTRFMFNEQYADFVLQFDYISSPIRDRVLPGGIATGGVANRYSPFYILFGSESAVSELDSAYALGIIEGNPTQYFWGAESMLSKSGKLGNGGVEVLATLREANADELASGKAIPWYKANNGVFTAETYGMPDTESGAYKYTFYNKTTRCKMVVLNNYMAFYVAEVNSDGAVGEYVMLYSQKVQNSFGYVGFGTDAPCWTEIDNFAITPIASSVAVEKGLDYVPEVNLVADVAPSDMDVDNAPVPLTKAQLTVDAETKKVSWTAVENAKEYKVTIKLGNEQVYEQTITETNVDLSQFTAEGSYSIAVESIPTNDELYIKSRSTTTYVVEKKSPSDNPTNPDKKKGCFGSVASNGSILGLVTLLGVVFVSVKKRKNI